MQGDPSSERQSKRRQTGSFLMMLGIVMAGVFWVPFVLLWPFWSFFVVGRDENQLRLLIYANAIIAIPFLLAAAAYSMRPLRTIGRSPLSWLATGGLIVAFLWPTVGIDSLRPLRALPEAAIAHPGSTVLGAWGDEGLDIGDGSDDAELLWDYHTDGSFDDVIAYYDGELTARGWTTVGRGSYQVYSYSGARCSYGWHRGDGYALIVTVPVDEAPLEHIAVPADLRSGGKYRVTLHDKPKRPQPTNGATSQPTPAANPCWRPAP